MTQDDSVPPGPPAPPLPVLEYQRPPTRRNLIDSVEPFARGSLLCGVAASTLWSLATGPQGDPPAAMLCTVVGMPLLATMVGAAVFALALVVRRWWLGGTFQERPSGSFTAAGALHVVVTAASWVAIGQLGSWTLADSYVVFALQFGGLVAEPVLAPLWLVRGGR